MSSTVRVRREPTVIPTYEPAAPDPNPMFLEKRVYQGSSGKVYPLPFIDRIAETPTNRTWDAIFLENEYVSLMMLPEIGGRIHAGKDLSNGYDFFYRQDVIKPALVGLAGPWASGGVEFNWPQHHRPATFMPTDVHVEHGDDGSVTVWMGDHEPMNRMKGMHGVCLHPGRSVIELKVRLYNRTPHTQTFLWWANMAIRVHEAYRSFFPPDAHMVADHAKRATSGYPLCESHYYGVDYGARGREGVPQDELPSQFLPANSGGKGPCYAPNDLSWYANIPVPTSYMCMGTAEDFFGGYDFFAGAGLLHVADHHLAPGKKQWTWGNHEFGYAWDRNLTDTNGPYIELMAGVYTDNQPDFSFIAPGETKTFSQYWYPYQTIGPVQFANLDAALSVSGSETGWDIGVAVTQEMQGARVEVQGDGRTYIQWSGDLAPDRPFVSRVEADEPVVLVLRSSEGKEVARFDPSSVTEGPVSPQATEPPMPAEIASADELYLTGLHLEQYRHATRSPVPYWEEALTRDPGDLRCNNAMGLWHLRRGEFDVAREFFEKAIARATFRNPNPSDGEPYYNLGLTLRFLGEDGLATNAFGKAVWNLAWQAPSYYALAELACKREDFAAALDYVNRSLAKDSDHLKARNLKALILEISERFEESGALVRSTLALDPLDWWARWLDGEELTCDNSVRIDLAIDLWRAGFTNKALGVLETADWEARDGTVPMVHFYRAALLKEVGPSMEVRRALAEAAETSSEYCFPARLEDIGVLQFAIREAGGTSIPNPFLLRPARTSGSQEEGAQARANFYLGNLLYDRRRHREAIACWQEAVRLEPDNAIAHRNLGIGSFNILGDVEAAKVAYESAVAAAPDDARLRYERDQLWKRIGITPSARLEELRKRPDLVQMRDDLTIEFCALLNAVGESEEAAEVLARRKFQPWEGGEGQALGAFVRTHLILGRRALKRGDKSCAKDHFLQALQPPDNLSEARHLLANASDVWLALGDASEGSEAIRWWSRAAEFRGDFQEMSVREFSELTYFQGLALIRLGRQTEARTMFEALDAYGRQLLRTEAKIDYFATSLPTMLLFDDDLQKRQDNSARFMRAQAAAGLGNTQIARTLLDEVLEVDPNHALANDLRNELTSA